MLTSIQCGGMVPPGWFEHPAQGLGHDPAASDLPGATQRFATIFLGIRTVSLWPSRGQGEAEMAPFDIRVGYT